MLQVSDVRQTRVFQEALEEGKGEGKAETIEKLVMALLEIKRPIEEIAQVTGLTAAQIRKLKKKNGRR